MKQVINFLMFCCVILAVIISVMEPKTVLAADINDNRNAYIYVNDVRINSEVNLLRSNNEIIMPMRAILEALGYDVYWEESTGNVFFDYAKVRYVCKFDAFSNGFPNTKSVRICKAEYKESTRVSEHISLHPMGATGICYMINNRIYLSQETGKRLFEALGCKVEVDLNSDSSAVRISKPFKTV